MFLETPFASGSFTVMLCFTRWPIIAAESHYVKCCKYQKHQHFKTFQYVFQKLLLPLFA